MSSRVLFSVLVVLALTLGLGAAPATAQTSDDLLPVCDVVGHNCGVVVGDGDGHILGDYFGHNIGTVLNEGDVARILELAENHVEEPAAAEPTPEPTDTSALLPLCDVVGHSCGVVVGDGDAAIIADFFGHNFGQVLDPADVDVILALAEQWQQQREAREAASDDTIWDRLADCESGGNWAHSSGFYEGGLQFHPATWDNNKPAGYPDAAYQATREQQIVVGERVRDRQGWGAWGHCAQRLGLA